MFGWKPKKEKVKATKTTTQFIDHVVAKNDTVRLIEIKTHLDNLNERRLEVEQEINSGNFEGWELNKKIGEFNTIALKINKLIEERERLSPKDFEVKPIELKEPVEEKIDQDDSNENEEIIEEVVPLKNIDEGRLVQLGSELRNLIIKKEGLERYIKNNTLSKEALKEKTEEYNAIIDQIENGRLEQNKLSGKNWNHEPLAKMTSHLQNTVETHGAQIKETPVTSKEVVSSDLNSPEETVTENAAGEIVPVSEDEFMKQLAVQMKMRLEIDRKIAEIKQENLELQKFIAEQEEIEKEKILKDKALEVIKKAKKEKIKRGDPKLAIFKKEWIDEIYGKGK